MKTKELIHQLQEADPSGEVECCVGNIDILFVSKEPGYYDGRRQELVRDPGKSGYNVVGGKITGSGDKIQIHTLSIEDALMNHPEMPVELVSADCYRADVERWRDEARHIRAEYPIPIKRNGLPTLDCCDKMQQAASRDEAFVSDGLDHDLEPWVVYCESDGNGGVRLKRITACPWCGQAFEKDGV